MTTFATTQRRSQSNETDSQQPGHQRSSTQTPAGTPLYLQQNSNQATPSQSATLPQTVDTDPDAAVSSTEDSQTSDVTTNDSSETSGGDDNQSQENGSDSQASADQSEQQDGESEQGSQADTAVEGEEGQQTVEGESQEEAEGETQSESDEPASATPSRDGRGEDSDKPLPMIIPPKLGIPTPQVPSPTPQIIKQSEKIRTETGTTPEQHHANVRQAVLRVADGARRAQRFIVFHVENLARNTRFTIDELASEIWSTVGTAVGMIESAIVDAENAVDEAAEAQLQHLTVNESLIGQELAENRERTTAEVHEQLIGGSEELQQAHTELQQEFSPYLNQAKTNIMAIPDAGVVTTIPPISTGGGSEGGSSEPAMSQDPSAQDQAGAGSESQQSLDMAGGDLQSTLLTLYESGAIGAYQSTRISPLLNAYTVAEQSRLEQAATRQAEQLDSMRAQFTTMTLGLIAPVQQDMQNDQPGNQETATREHSGEQDTAEAARERNYQEVINKREGVKGHLRNVLMPRLVQNVRKAGRKAVKGLQKQALVAENAIQSAAAPMADAYPDLVMRIAELVPPGRLLDSRALLPRLQAALESVDQLNQSQLRAIEPNAVQAIEQAQNVQRQQMDSLIESAHKNIESINDVVTATRFELDLFGYQVTGVMREGGQASIEGAVDYAQRVATDLLKTKGQADGALTNVLSATIGSLNQAITNAGNNYFSAVQAFKERMDNPGSDSGVFQVEKNAVDGDLNSRSQQLKNALPVRSTTAVVGLAAASVVTLGGAAVATGVYLYATDADEDDVFRIIGNLQWPGPPALAEYFEGPAEFGNLYDRIRESMDEDDATRALGLFSADAATRFESRSEAVQDSGGLFGYGREARESLMQGFSAEERAAADPGDVEELGQYLRDNLTGTELTISESYFNQNPAGALAARIQENLTRARRQGDDAIFQSIDGIENLVRQELAVTQSAASITPEQVQELTDQAIREFAAQRPGETDSADDISLEEARTTFINTATADRAVHVHHGHGGMGGAHASETIYVPVDQRVRDYVESVVTHGADSDEAWSAKAAYEFAHAESDWYGPSESSQTRFTTAFENQTLYSLEQQLREHPEQRDTLEPQIAREREKHERRLAMVARRLDPDITDEELAEAGGATEWMARRAEGMFSDEEDAADRNASERDSALYARQIITRGRADAALGTRIATRGLGTNEELLRHTWTNRTKAEAAQARTDWAARAGDWGEEADLDVMLGIKEREWGAGDYALFALSPMAAMISHGGETSGDLAFELEILTRGNPETHQDHVEIAALRYNQQRHRGTGFIAQMTMSGTPETRRLDARQEELANLLLTTARSSDPNNPRLPDGPDGVFDARGNLHPEVAALAFISQSTVDGQEQDHHFQGNPGELFRLTHEIDYASQNYRAEIDRQESIMTGAITVLAIVASIALMLIPGVNLVAAGILTALIAGAATIAVKAGMRGGRYGWEEMATDAAMTGIEAATAGIGGGLAGGLGKAGMAGRLASIGGRMQARFGALGASMLREGITNAVSSAAQITIQDETWYEGPGKGLERLMLGGVRGAAVGAVTAGVSEGLEGRLTRALGPGLTDPSKLSAMQRLGQTLGPNGREVFTEALTEAMGSVAGESVGVAIDAMSGQHRGGLKAALRQIGEAGLRDMISGAGRAGVRGANRARYNHLLRAARSGAQVTNADLHILRLAAISAGVSNYGEGIGNIRNEVIAGRHTIEALPPSLRDQARSFDQQTLTQLQTMLQTGDLGTPKDRLDLINAIRSQVPGLDARSFLRQLNEANTSLRDAEAKAQLEQRQRDKRVRTQLVSGLEGPVRRSMRDVPLEGLDRLSPDQLQQAADMIARGNFDLDTANTMLRAAKAEDPDVDDAVFVNNLRHAVEAARLARQAEHDIRHRQREDVLEAVPEAARVLLTDVPDKTITQIKRLFDQESTGTPQQRESLFREARKTNPDLTRDRFEEFLKAGVAHHREQSQIQRSERRHARQEQMASMPEELRGPLSALPDDALLELRVLGAEGQPLSPQARQRLLDAAARETPDVDPHMLSDVLDEAVAHYRPDRVASGGEEAKLRAHLVDSVPQDRRHLLDEVPILIVRADEFQAFTRSESGQAVTVIIHGRPVVFLKEGVTPSVLREEGIHVLQSKDPDWTQRVDTLDERTLAEWDRLPLEEQFSLLRNKLEIEIDAHHRLVDDLSSRRTGRFDTEGAADLQRQVERAQTALANLQNRHAEVTGHTAVQRRAIKAGTLPRPDWLDQPARMFAKDDDPTRAEVHQEFQSAQELVPERNRIMEDLDLSDLNLSDDMLQGAHVWNARVGAMVPVDPSRSSMRMAAGRYANELQTQRRGYPISELYIETPFRSRTGRPVYYRVDNYDPHTGEIIERKNTQLASLSPHWAREYLLSIWSKYPPTARIADVPSTPAHLRGAPLSGHNILEVPVQRAEVPAEVLDFARELGISIRDYDGNWILRVDEQTQSHVIDPGGSPPGGRPPRSSADNTPGTTRQTTARPEELQLRGPRMDAAPESREGLRQQHEDWVENIRHNYLAPGTSPPRVRGEVPRPERPPWHRDMESAYAAYDAAVREHQGKIEVGIVRNVDTGEYMVVRGSPVDIRYPTEALRQETVLHYHPDYGPSLYRGPSGTDLRNTASVAFMTGRPATEFIEYDIPGIGRGRTAYTLSPVNDPAAPGGRRMQIDIEYVDPSGQYVHRRFANFKEWTAYYHSPTTALDPDSPIYRHIMRSLGGSSEQIDAAAARHRTTSESEPSIETLPGPGRPTQAIIDTDPDSPSFPSSFSETLAGRDSRTRGASPRENQDLPRSADTRTDQRQRDDTTPEHRITDVPAEASAGVPKVEGKYRDTLGWSGTPTQTPSPGQTHLRNIQRGLEVAEMIQPELKSRLDEILPQLDNVLPANQKRINELQDEMTKLNGEHGRILMEPRAVVERRLGVEGAELKDRLEQRVAQIETESARLQQEIDDIRIPLEQEALELMKTFRKRLLGRTRGAAELAEQFELTPSAIAAARAKERSPSAIRRDIQEYFEFTSKKGPRPEQSPIVSIKDRAETVPRGHVDIGKTEVSKRIVYHEMAHHLEFNDPRLRQASEDFIKARARRAGGEGELIPLRDLVPDSTYRLGEVALVGEFIDPYTGRMGEMKDGKFIPPSGYEVISTGIERFRSAEHMLDLYRQDPEHFFFVLGSII